MYKGPQISNERCKELSEESGLEISNRSYKGASYPVTKEGSKIIDTAINYVSEDYDKIIKELKGKVLILGLGMGRGAIEACANTKVKEVTVIEINQGVVDLFWAIYGHGFKGVKKLSIEVKDANDYKKTEYDNVFIDIFHPPFNKSLYVKTMGVLRDRFKKTNIHFIDLY
jgi:16S rRNA G966 N2-methylase RsmD